MANDPEITPQETIDSSLDEKEEDILDRLESAVKELGEKLEALGISEEEPIGKVPELPIQSHRDTGNVLKGGAEKAAGVEFRKEIKKFSEAVTTTIVGLHIEQNRLKVEIKKLLAIIIVLALAVVGIGIFSIIRP